MLKTITIQKRGEDKAKQVIIFDSEKFAYLDICVLAMSDFKATLHFQNAEKIVLSLTKIDQVKQLMEIVKSDDEPQPIIFDAKD